MVLSGCTPFDFMRPLLKNHVENIRQVVGSDRAKVYQARMEQLGSYVADLRNLEGTNIVEIAQLVLGKLRAEQRHSFEETKKEIAERTDWSLILHTYYHILLLIIE